MYEVVKLEVTWLDSTTEFIEVVIEDGTLDDEFFNQLITQFPNRPSYLNDETQNKVKLYWGTHGEASILDSETNQVIGRLLMTPPDDAED